MPAPRCGWGEGLLFIRGRTQTEASGRVRTELGPVRWEERGPGKHMGTPCGQKGQDNIGIRGGGKPSPWAGEVWSRGRGRSKRSCHGTEWDLSPRPSSNQCVGFVLWIHWLCLSGVFPLDCSEWSFSVLSWRPVQGSWRNLPGLPHPPCAVT